MSAKERREHLEKAVARGGVIMTARGAITRQVPSSSTLARTPEEKRAAHEDIQRRARLLEEEARQLAGDDERGFRFGGFQSREGDFEPRDFGPDERARPAGGSGMEGGDRVGGAGAGSEGTGVSDNGTSGGGPGGPSGGGGSDELGEGFPGREALAKAGITKRSELAGFSKEDLASIVDKTTAGKILAGLKQP